MGKFQAIGWALLIVIVVVAVAGWARSRRGRVEAKARDEKQIVSLVALLKEPRPLVVGGFTVQVMTRRSRGS